MKLILNCIYKIFNIRFTIFHYIFFIFFSIIIMLFVFINISSIQTKISNIFLNKINKEFNINLSLDELNINFISGVIKINKFKLLDYKKNIVIYIPFMNFHLNFFDIIFNRKKIKIKNLSINNSIFNIITYKGSIENNIYKIIKFFIYKYKNKKNYFTKKITFFNINIKKSILMVTNLNNNNINKLIFLSRNINIIFNNLLFFNSKIKFDKLNIIFNGILKNKYIDIHNYYNNGYISLHKIKILNTYFMLNNSKIYGSILFYYKYKIIDLLKFYKKIKFFIEIKKNSYISKKDIQYFYNFKLKKNIFLYGKIYGSFDKNIILKDFFLKNEKNIIISKKIIFYNILDKKKYKIFQTKYTYLSTCYNNIINIIPNKILSKYPFFLKNFGTIKYSGELIVDNDNIISKGYIYLSNIGYFNGNFILNKISNTYQYNGKINIFNPYIFFKIKSINNIKCTIFFRGNLFISNKMFLKLDIISGILTINNKKIDNINFSFYYYNNFIYGNIYIKNSELKLKCYIKSFFYINTNNFFINSLININYLYLNFFNLKLLNINNIFNTNIYLRIRYLDINNLNINFFLDKINIIDNKSFKTYYDNISIFYNISKSIKKFTIYVNNIFDISLIGNFHWFNLIKILKNNIKSILYNENYIINNNKEFLVFKINFKKKFSTILLDLCNLKLIGTLKNNNISINIENIKYKDFILKKLYFNSIYNNYINLIIDSITYKKNIHLQNISFFIKKEKKYNLINLKYIGYIYNIYQYCNINFYKKNIILNRKKYIILGLNYSHLRINDNNWIINNNKKKSIILIDLTNKKYLLNKLTYYYNKNYYTISYRKLKNKYTLLEVFLNSNFFLKNNITNNKSIGRLFIINNNNFSDIEINLKLEKIFINNNIWSISFNSFYNKNYNLYNIIININNNDVNIINISTNINNNFNLKNFLLDIKINIKDFPIIIFKKFTEGILDNIRGYFSGNFEIHINNNNINYYGFFFLKNIGMKINYLNTEYEFIDDPFIIIKKKIIILNNINIRDVKYNTIARFNGIIINENNKYILSLSVDSKKFLILDTKNLNGNSLYGKIFSKGKLHILYDNDNININVNDSKILNNSKLYITTIINSNNEIENINFINNKSLKILNFIENIKNNSQEYHKIFNINIKYHINDKCDIKLIIDSSDTNTFIKVNGFGNFLLKINSYDDIEMIGKYYINNGYYNFFIEKIPMIKINKKFKIKKGGIIIWNGIYNNPLLYITASYNANYLFHNNIEDNNINSILFNNNIINLIISGTLNNPIFKFEINFPFFYKKK